MKIVQTLQNLQSFAQILEKSVHPCVKKHWDEKIADGIVPTEEKRKGPVDYSKHLQQMENLVAFEVSTVSRLFKDFWCLQDGEIPKELHYFGIGTGLALQRIVPIANHFEHKVVAYDTSSVACDNGTKAFIGEKLQNEVYLADIETACSTRFIPKKGSIKLIVSRVLGVLDTEEKNWAKKIPSQRKMARTARKIGKLVSLSAECLLIHACPEDNPDAVWGDTTSHTLEEILGYMQEGAMRRQKLAMTTYGKVRFHSHVYTAALVHIEALQRKD